MSIAGKFSPVLALYSLTLFISAALMFAVQPMVGKMLLPIVGGTPAGWIVAMAFFQVMLLAGYFLAHALSTFSARIHGVIFIGSLCLAWFFLPIHLPAADNSGMGPVAIFRLLCICVAVPFIALSATSSTLQRLFTTTNAKAAQDPYFLYAASNAGSFIGLFLYPLVFEPLWGLSAQAGYWKAGFALLIGAVILCQFLSGKTETAKTVSISAPVTREQRVNWLLLAFFPSALLSAVTTHITTDVFSAPMIWVLPLALYLLTFVIAFSGKLTAQLPDIARLQQVAVPLGIGLLCVFNTILRVSVLAMFLHLAVFTLVALVCHMQLANKRPDAKNGGGRALTEFYLFMSLGGALGGILNAFVVPFVFDRIVEYPILLILSCVMNPDFRKPMTVTAKLFFGFSLLTLFMYLAYVSGNAALGQSASGRLSTGVLVADVLLFTVAILMATSLRAAFYGSILLMLSAQFIVQRDIVMTTRNFYGVVKVIDVPEEIDGKQRTVRYMYHGTTTHGYQVKDPEYEKKPTAYFWAGGPVGIIFSLFQPKNIGVIGLGTGTFNCYSNKNNAFTFFEIDEAVKRVAENQFTFLSACHGSRPPRIIMGDGRLEIAKSPETFDLIALDAFASDTIPTHLLTRDAVETYLSKLSKGGVIIFNLSNRYFTLAKPLQRIATDLNLNSRVVLDIPKTTPYASASLWFAVAKADTDLSALDDYGWVALPPSKDLRIWTDDYTNLLSTLE